MVVMAIVPYGYNPLIRLESKYSEGAHGYGFTWLSVVRKPNYRSLYVLLKNVHTEVIQATDGHTH